VLTILNPTAARADVLRIAQDQAEAKAGRSMLEKLRAVLGSDKPIVLVDLPTGAMAGVVSASGHDAETDPTIFIDPVQ